MAYVAVTGGKEAIAESIRLLQYHRCATETPLALEAVEKSKEADLFRVIFALGIRNIGQKACGFYNFIHCSPRCLQKCFNVFANLFGLVGYVFALDCAVRGVGGYLPRRKNKVAAYFCLGVGAYRRRRAVCRYCFHKTPRCFKVL